MNDLKATPTIPRIPVMVKRSARRTRTVSARMVGDVLEVSVPAWMSANEEADWIDRMAGRFERQRRRMASDGDLSERAEALARRYRLPHAASIRFVDNMDHRWGSCTMPGRTVRISSRVATFPGWVLDAVIVHELAHIAHPDHSRGFWELARRHPRTERAIGYLTAKGEG